LSRKMPNDLRVIVANCLVHGRRNFVDVVEAFPAEVQYVLECRKKVYQTDAEAKQQQLSPDERLRLHQAQSGPLMNELRGWLTVRFAEKLVEPSSSMEGAISYIRKHWDRFRTVQPTGCRPANRWTRSKTDSRCHPRSSPANAWISSTMTAVNRATGPTPQTKVRVVANS